MDTEEEKEKTLQIISELCDVVRQHKAETIAATKMILLITLPV